MAIWDITAGILEGEFHNPGKVLNTSYNSVLGDNISFTIGGGSFSNTFGMANSINCDWEVLLAHFIPTTGSWPVLEGLLFGSGGNTNMLFGDSTAFKYYGHDLVISLARHPLCFNAGEDTGKIPSVVATTGILLLLAAALVLRFVYQAQMKVDNPHEHAIELASMIIPMAETRFLALLKLAECSVGLKAAEKVLATAKGELDAAKVILADGTAALEVSKTRVINCTQLRPPINQVLLASAQAEFKAEQTHVAQATVLVKTKQMAMDIQTAALGGAWLGQAAHP